MSHLCACSCVWQVYISKAIKVNGAFLLAHPSLPWSLSLVTKTSAVLIEVFLG